jgi:folate-dependent phosphoribosylglycinamide formyltransferase PurN
MEFCAKSRDRPKSDARHGLNIAILTNDNFFSATVLKEFLQQRRQDIKLIVFSSALIGGRGTTASIIWSLCHTGFRHTIFKLLVYAVFRLLNTIYRLLPFIPSPFSSRLWARQNNVPSISTNSINDPEVIERIREAGTDLIISVSMNQIVRKELLTLPPNRCINVHCAPLPRYAGMSPYVWALANNEDHSAVTIHYMEEGLDEGDIIVQQKEPVMKGDSAFCLFYRCCLRAAGLLPEVVRQIKVGTVTSRQQDLTKKTYYSWPSRECIRMLHKNGYSLARLTDFTRAIFGHRPRLSAGTIHP